MPFSVGAESDFIIENFNGDITIQKNGIVSVEETIDVLFYEARHGIYRDMPYVYKRDDNTKIYTDIAVNTVTDGTNNIPFEISRNQSNLRIKIGDPKVTVTGNQKYVINYSVSGVLASFNEYDEVYWNVTGTNGQRG